MIGWRNNPESTDAEYKEKDFGDTVLCGTLILVTSQSRFSDPHQSSLLETCARVVLRVPDKASGLWVFFSLTVP